ncbi:hypothetical protein [Hartmannibacter diazotrophicus]|uniref:hypothetical protein n=1 Tax=Hartmannibacter diazotrophicus TaxID=1482074 RepID=UPI0012FDDA57|nr:hypothetical protein [Hartmannibacter diazotrophicus]
MGVARHQLARSNDRQGGVLGSTGPEGEGCTHAISNREEGYPAAFSRQILAGQLLKILPAFAKSLSPRGKMHMSL